MDQFVSLSCRRSLSQIGDRHDLPFYARSLRSLALWHGVNDFRRGGTPAVLLDDLAEEYDTLAIDKER